VCKLEIRGLIKDKGRRRGRGKGFISVRLTLQLLGASEPGWAITKYKTTVEQAAGAGGFLPKEARM
jgi:hypothetical protein